MEYRSLIIENSPGRATQIVDYFLAHRHPALLWRAYAEPLPRGDWTGVIASGGPQHVVQSIDEEYLFRVQDVLLRTAEQRRPLLAICLSHQLLSRGLGASLASYEHPVVGFETVRLTPAGQQDALLGGRADSLRSFEYHLDYVSAPPPDALLLADSTSCGVEAYRLRDAPVWSLQFHPEISPTTATTILRTRGLNREAESCVDTPWDGTHVLDAFRRQLR